MLIALGEVTTLPKIWQARQFFVNANLRIIC